MTGEPLAVAARGLTKRYGPILALDGLDFDVPAGSAYGLLGPAGAGKTTTLRLLAGLARPTSGHVSVTGLQAGRTGGRGSAGAARTELRRRIGALEQEPRFYGWMTGRELLEFVADLLGLGGETRRSRVEDTLECVGLADVADRRVATYSAGLRQRLGIGQAIVGEASLVVLDEPFASLEADARHEMAELVAKLRGSATVILATHVIEDVEALCDRIAVLDEGRLVAEGPTTRLLDRLAPAAYRIEVDPGQASGLGHFAEAVARQGWAGPIETDGTALRVGVRDGAVAANRLVPLLGTSGLSVVSVERERPALVEVVATLDGDGR